jgi:hypothetical protein
MSTEIPAHAQPISIHLQQLKARFIPRNTCPLTTTSHHPSMTTTQNTINYVLPPPAIMTNPWFGSDVAAIVPNLTTLRAAVVQRPLVASKIFTTLLQPPAHTQPISIHLQQLKARFIPRNTCPLTPTSHHPSMTTTQNKINYVLPPLPPMADMANP